MFDTKSFQSTPDLFGYDALPQALVPFGNEDLPLRTWAASAAINPESDYKAGQLARSHSRHQLEFLANMSHELRAPLNSMLILAKLLAENSENNLSSTQINYAQTIYSAGTHLRSLIDITLDSAKMESSSASLNIEAEQRVSPVAAAKRRDAVHDTTEKLLMPVVQPRPYQGPKSRRSDDGFVLIVEGDAQIASLMLDLVLSNGYQGQVVTDPGMLQGLIGNLTPDAIILGMNQCNNDDGWAVFDRLRHDPETRQLPVSMVCLNEGIHKCLQIGLCGSDGRAIESVPMMATTPQATLSGLSAVAGRDIRKLLLADAAESLRPDAGVAWRINGTEVVVVGTGARVVDTLQRENFDGMILGAALLDMSAGDLMKRVMATDLSADLPIAMLGMARNADGGWAEIGILKRHNEFAEVLAETSQFLHRSVGYRPAARQNIPSIRRMHTLELAGRKVLIVDDIRNIYAITGILEQQGMIVLHAENSAEGIDVLRANPDTDLVLVDTTVVGSGSHEMIDLLRDSDEFKSLPVIAVTDKAAPGKRRECIEAGASDTIDKPVNVEQLSSLLRAWLVRG